MNVTLNIGSVEQFKRDAHHGRVNERLYTALHYSPAQFLGMFLNHRGWGRLFVENLSIGFHGTVRDDDGVSFGYYSIDPFCKGTVDGDFIYLHFRLCVEGKRQDSERR